MPVEKVLDTLTDDTTFSDRTKKILSIIFLIAAFAISFRVYAGKYFFSSDITIKPTMLSGIIAITMLLPLYVRGILVWRKTIYKLIVFVLLVSVFASISNIALQGESKITTMLITAAIALSWLGMRGVAGLGWILVFIAATYNLVTVSEAMGVFGFVFIASAFLGLIFHADLAPERLIGEMMDEYKIKTKKVASHISGDLDEAAAKVQEKFEK